MNIIFIFICFIFFKTLKCEQCNKNLCYKYLYLNSYIECIISSNKKTNNFAKIEKCINKYGNNIYNENSTYTSYNFSEFCDNTKPNEDIKNKIKVSQNLYDCILKLNKNHKYKRKNCNDFICN